MIWFQKLVLEVFTASWWTNKLPKLYSVLEFLSDFHKFAIKLRTASWWSNNLAILFLCLEFLSDFQKLFTASRWTNNLPKLFLCLEFLSNFQNLAINLFTTSWWTNNLPKIVSVPRVLIWFPKNLLSNCLLLADEQIIYQNYSLCLELLSDFQKLAIELFPASWWTNNLPKLFLCHEFLSDFQKLAIELFTAS